MTWPLTLLTPHRTTCSSATSSLLWSKEKGRHSTNLQSRRWGPMQRTVSVFFPGGRVCILASQDVGRNTTRESEESNWATASFWPSERHQDPCTCTDRCQNARRIRKIEIELNSFEFQCVERKSLCVGFAASIGSSACAHKCARIFSKLWFYSKKHSLFGLDGCHAMRQWVR